MTVGALQGLAPARHPSKGLSPAYHQYHPDHQQHKPDDPRGGLIGCRAIPSRPKRSITISRCPSWPAMTRAVNPLTPSVRTVRIATVHIDGAQQASDPGPGGRLWRPDRSFQGRHRTASRPAPMRTVPTTNEKVAACTLPMLRPRRELTGACIPTRTPAQAARTTASVRVTSPPASSDPRRCRPRSAGSAPTDHTSPPRSGHTRPRARRAALRTRARRGS